MSYSKVHSIQAATFFINKKNPPEISIHAKGEVPTTGWTNAQLIPFMYITPPNDGIQEFDFTANSPEGVVFEVFSPIVANYYFEKPNWMRGFKIYTSSNNSKVMLNSQSYKTINIGPKTTTIMLPNDDEFLDEDSYINILYGGEDPFPWKKE